MDRFSFVFTILFMLLGPLKTLGPFAQLMKGADEAYVRAVSVRATLIASVLVAFVALAGGSLPAKYGISMQALAIAGGLVLLISALRNMFPEPDAPHPERGDAKPMQLAVSPVALPIIVPPAGVAALLIFAMMQARYPGNLRAVLLSLAIIMALNFLVMIFNRAIVRAAPLMLVLKLLGAVLVFVQVALAVNTMLSGLNELGVVGAGTPS